MPFVVEWWCNGTLAWEPFEFSDAGKHIKNRADAEAKVKTLTEDYDPKRMTGFHPNLVRVREIDDELRSEGSHALSSS